jgi:lysophospholipase L1-like esterase
MASFTRFIALGDSFTEGMCDEKFDGHYRGWADRVADVLSTLDSDFTYVNLAVRGKVLHQVIDEQLPAAIPFITGKETLITFHAGANDVLRPKYQPEIAFAKYRQAVADLAKTGATLMLFTVIETVDGKGKTADLWVERFTGFNKNVRAVAAEFGAILMEAQQAPWLADRRFLATDRLHLNEDGHWRMAHAVLEGLSLPFDAAWKIPLPPAPHKSLLRKRYEGFYWFATFALPWIWRRIRGKSSGDGLSAKFPTPTHWAEQIH